MERFLMNLIEDLNESSDSQIMITVKRSDLESLITAYQNNDKAAAATATKTDVINLNPKTITEHLHSAIRLQPSESNRQ